MSTITRGDGACCWRCLLKRRRCRIWAAAGERPGGSGLRILGYRIGYAVGDMAGLIWREYDQLGLAEIIRFINHFIPAFHAAERCGCLTIVGGADAALLRAGRAIALAQQVRSLSAPLKHVKSVPDEVA